MASPHHTSADGQLTGSLPEFLAFQWFVTPWVIQVIFWIEVIGVIGGAGTLAISGITAIFNDAVLPGLGLLVAAMAALVIGLILARVYCELLILAFKVFDRLGEISRKLDR